MFGMQPEKLREFFDDEADDGLAARFLYTGPTHHPGFLSGATQGRR
jgi:hypothetical protein